MFNDVLRNFLFKEIFKGCCLLFSYQGSCRSFLATALISYQIRSALSRTFLFFFSAVPLSSRSASSDSLYRLSHLQGVVNSFFICFFSPVFSALPAPFDPRPVISDRCYLITRKWNCQCFFSFLFISDNSHNSVIIQPYRKETIKMEFVYNENQIALYSEKGKLMETLAKDLEQRDLKTAPPALTL